MPGIGPKLAQRLAIYILQQPREDTEVLISCLQEVKEKITYCPICFNITDTKPCAICNNEDRDKSIICVVESPADAAAIEKMGEYKGQYHILQGVLSPLDGIHPEDLRIKELINRIQKMLCRSAIKEVIIATNPSVEGEVTALYLAKLIKPLNIKVTRIAHGLPVGGDIDYADEITLMRAIEGRREM